jgi:hypothetical protein
MLVPHRLNVAGLIQLQPLTQADHIVYEKTRMLINAITAAFV